MIKTHKEFGQDVLWPLWPPQDLSLWQVSMPKTNTVGDVQDWHTVLTSTKHEDMRWEPARCWTHRVIEIFFVKITDHDSSYVQCIDMGRFYIALHRHIVDIPSVLLVSLPYFGITLDYLVKMYSTRCFLNAGLTLTHWRQLTPGWSAGVAKDASQMVNRFFWLASQYLALSSTILNRY